MKKRKQIYSFTADQELIDQAIAVAVASDQNFSKFVCESLKEKIEKEIGKQAVDSKKEK